MNLLSTHVKIDILSLICIKHVDIFLYISKYIHFIRYIIHKGNNSHN